jgi:hypothetical protein
VKLADRPPVAISDGVAAGRRSHGRPLRVGVLVVIALAVLVHVPIPFWGDQALFSYAANGMRHGDRLYVDFWDFKQPGIFLWYLVSGTVFGFSEIGIHVAELIWSVAFAVCIQQVMRSRVKNRWVADVAPLLTVGAFYAAASGFDLTQVEYLVAFPLLISLWAAADAGDGRIRSRNLLISGLAASVVVYFKLVYVLIPVGFWLYLMVERLRSNGWRETRRDSVKLLGGLILPLVPLLAYFVQQRLLGTMWWTYVTYPPKIVRSIDPPPFSRLRDGVSFFVKNFAWLGVLAIAGRVAARSSSRRRRDPLVVGLAIWFVLGWATVLIQNQWGYQFMLPLVPLGLFACVGLDRLATATRRARVAGEGRKRRLPAATLAIVGFTTLFALYPAKQAIHKVKTLAGDGFALSANGREKLDDSLGHDYDQARAAADFVREPGRAPGPIHVEGNPLIQYLSGRDFALRLHGWAPEMSDARLWKWTRDGLREKRPVYLWVDQFSENIMRGRSRETLSLIHAMYCPVKDIGDGTWYALRGSRDCRPGDSGSG